MQGSTGQNESLSSEDAREDQNTLVEPFLWTLQFITVTYLFYRMWTDDEIRLHVLHAITRILQTLARVLGGWALEFEQAYNEYVKSLH